MRTFKLGHHTDHLQSSDESEVYWQNPADTADAAAAAADGPGTVAGTTSTSGKGVVRSFEISAREEA